MAAPTAGTIIDQALAKLLVFDQGRSDLGNDDPELFKVLNRTLNRFYRQASAPVMNPHQERNDYFEVTESLTMAGSPATDDCAGFQWAPRIENASGARVWIVSKSDLVLGRAELPPAVWLQGLTVTTGARTGDPVDTDVLTVRYTPIPGPLADRDHYIGATTPATQNTSKWPTEAGDEALILALAVYLALKSGDLPGDELQILAAEAQAQEAQFLAFVRTVR